MRRREGNSFKLEQLEIELLDGQRVAAFTPVNDHTRATYIKDLDTDQLAKIVRVADGTSGKCSEYVINLRGKLIDIGIEDEVVENLWRSIVNKDSA